MKVVRILAEDNGKKKRIPTKALRVSKWLAVTPGIDTYQDAFAITHIPTGRAILHWKTAEPLFELLSELEQKFDWDFRSLRSRKVKQMGPAIVECMNYWVSKHRTSGSGQKARKTKARVTRGT